MSFLAERLFQVLDTHKIYEHLKTSPAIRKFMEHHFICAWGYHAILRSIDRELSSAPVGIYSHDLKEALKLVSEIILDEEVADLGDGRLSSHFELYLEAMQDMGCDVTPLLDFMDNLDSGQDLVEAARQADLPAPVIDYAAFVSGVLREPIHLRAVALFYEGEPYLPDALLIQTSSLLPRLKVGRFLDYMERHIEGIKHPGFSPAARLVEVFCGNDIHRNEAAEKMAERVLQVRVQFWNQLMDKLQQEGELLEVPVVRTAVSHLRLVR